MVWVICLSSSKIFLNLDRTSGVVSNLKQLFEFKYLNGTFRRRDGGGEFRWRDGGGAGRDGPRLHWTLVQGEIRDKEINRSPIAQIHPKIFFEVLPLRLLYSLAPGPGNLHGHELLN